MSNYTKPHPALDDPNAFVLYRYHPSMAAAVTFMLLFMATTLIHTYQMVKKKAWYFMPFIIGGICEFLLALIFPSAPVRIPHTYLPQ